MLSLVTAAMVAHYVQWKYGGPFTVSPVEPSETAYTIRSGEVNAGFFLFVILLGGTALLGRFFCGWGCHVVALQDLCQFLLKKMGIRPRPFRSRLLLFGPLLIGLYVFVWPAVQQHLVLPLLSSTGLALPKWMDPILPFPGFEERLIVKDFWRTFPPWYIAIPFLFVCGFATVYFLGAKGFCTYGCPYGGFFAPLDRLSRGRIVVSDACEGCGHCTAVCTSNVIVHEEVRDHGMVLDPGCMKCLDCVSVCPNEALRFAFAAPAPRTAAGATGRVRHYDLTLRQEITVAAVGLFLCWSFVGMLGRVPLLMASGMAGIGAFLSWKLSSLRSSRQVRVQNLRLKYEGRMRPAGWLFALFAISYLALGAWSFDVKASRFVGTVIDSRVQVPLDAALAPGYRAADADRESAASAVAILERSLSPEEGGHGWMGDRVTDLELAKLHTVLGELNRAQSYLERAIELEKPTLDLVIGLGKTLSAEGRSPREIREAYERVLSRYPDLYPVRLAVAMSFVEEGQPERAAEAAEQVIAALDANGPPGNEYGQAIEILLRTGKVERGLRLVEQAVSRAPSNAMLRMVFATGLMMQNQPDRAIAALLEAERLAPDDPAIPGLLAQLYDHSGRPDEAARYRAKATAAERRRGGR